ncbi:type II toxin-antitoxin system Phd/YefM family antitoxin [Cupriavidus basilensis]
MQTIPFSEARAHLADVLRDAESGQEPLLISRRGQPAAVLMSWSQYRLLVGSSPGFFGRLSEWRSEHVQAEDEADPFEHVRQSGDGRDFTW